MTIFSFNGRTAATITRTEAEAASGGSRGGIEYIGQIVYSGEGNYRDYSLVSGMGDARRYQITQQGHLTLVDKSGMDPDTSNNLTLPDSYFDGDAYDNGGASMVY